MLRGREISSFVSVFDEKRMSAIKRLLLGNFTINSFLRQEPELDQTLSSLMKYLEDTGKGIESGKAFGYWAFDSISRIALSEDQAFLSQQKDCGDTLAGATQRLAHWHYWGALPVLERLIFKNPLMQKFQTSSTLGTIAAQRMQMRLQQEKETDLESQVDLLGKYLAASRRDPDLIKPVDVIGFLVSTMHAGSETTGQAVAGILSVLLQHPEKMTKLEEEILSALLGDMPQFGDANKLPYLDSVIREFLRLRRGGLSILERTVPGDGATIDGIWVPGGTDVSVSTAVVNMDPEIWGPNPEQFVPERCIGISDEKLKMMDHADLSFSTGRRMCIGRNLAMIEMKKALARMIKIFEVSTTLSRPSGRHRC
jgi:cytochrome P450